MNKSGIYMIMNTYNNKCYVGSTSNFRKRKSQHFRSLLLNKHHSQHLQKAYNKYGKEKFVFIILEECVIEKLTDREIFWINLKDSLNPKYGYNIGIPKTNDILKLREEDIIRRKINAHKQFYQDNRITLEEFLNGKRSKDLRVKGNVVSKEKVFVFNKNTGIKEYEFESISKAASHFKISQKRISDVCNGRKKSWVGYIFIKEKDYNPETEYRIVYKKDLPKEPRIPIIRQPFKGNPFKCTNIETGEELLFNNRFEAIEQLGFTQSGIDKVLYGKRKSHKGYKFELIKNATQENV